MSIKFLQFTPRVDAVETKETTVDTYDDVPKEMDIFWRDEHQFLPEGKTWEDLTPEELKLVRNRYRFDYLKPGIYQAISGISSAQH